MCCINCCCSARWGVSHGVYASMSVCVPVWVRVCVCVNDKVAAKITSYKYKTQQQQ